MTTKTITYNGQIYQLDNFDEKVGQLVSIHETWKADVVKERLALAKTEAALRSLESELAVLVEQQLAVWNTPKVEQSDEVVAKGQPIEP